MLAQDDSEHKSNAKYAAKSRLFWEFKAEQVLNRIFDQHHRNVSSESAKTFTDVEYIDCTTLGAKKTKENERKINWTAKLTSKTWLALSATSLTTLLLTTILLSSKQRYQSDQENNLKLLSLLRHQEKSEQAQESNQAENGNTTTNTYPPTPPNEEWIEELAKLPPSTGDSLELLKVPLNGTTHSPRPISRSTTMDPKPSTNGENSLPKLVGVIQGAGTNGSAIFQWGGSSSSVNSGETIGTSNWRLRTVNGNIAIIERGGQLQRLSINENN